jgi:hypothetical protein
MKVTQILALSGHSIAFGLFMFSPRLTILFLYLYGNSGHSIGTQTNFALGYKRTKDIWYAAQIVKWMSATE